VSGSGPAVEGQELVDGAGRVASDLGGVEFEGVAEKKSDLDVSETLNVTVELIA
jgi:hypothetical protein